MSKESTKEGEAKEGRIKVVALYKFVSIPEDKLAELKKEVDSNLRAVNARGIILLATEGINGTICYPEQHTQESGGDDDGNDDETHDTVLEFLKNHPLFTGLRTRVSFNSTLIFQRLKVKIKKDIVTMLDDEGAAVDSKKDNAEKKVDPADVVGTYVKPGKEWDDLLNDPDVVVIDTRNKYEVQIGTFENAISPNTDNFKQFPDWLHKFSETCQNLDDEKNRNDRQCVENNENVITTATASASADGRTPAISQDHNPRSKRPALDMPAIHRKPKAVAMFCTGGIRCEKSTSYALKTNVFPPDVPVYHLEGGILAYLDNHKDPNESKWKGECFVFDKRVALTHGLHPSETYNSCHACRRPVSTEDKKGKDFIPGISCKHCKHEKSEEERRRFVERQKQVQLSEERGEVHMFDPKEAAK